ncbi:apolipoprotein N-acyltransferase [Candidatus Poribacteria bacterium]|nr:apolipoprotein N-acyltransferase [Candidatus Poribacteria bacterium]
MNSPSLWARFCVPPWQPRALACLSGVLVTLALPDWNLAPLGWVALVPLLSAVSSARSLTGAVRLGWLSGFAGFLGTIGWLYSLGPYTGLPLPWGWVASSGGAILLAAYLALYVALFAVLTRWLLPESGWRFVFGVPVLWVTAEWLRGWVITGFPWGALGTTQWNLLPIAQAASLGGVPLISFGLALIGATVINAARRRTSRRAMAYESLPAAILTAFLLAHGFYALSESRTPVDTVRVAIVPGNIPQGERWSRELLESNFDDYLALMGKAGDARIDLLALPETSLLLPYLDPRQQERVTALLREKQMPLLFGTPRVSRRGTLREGYNAAVLLDANGQFVDEYYKQHLVPFGEYVPLREYLPKFLVEDVIGVADYNFGKQSNVLTLARADRPAIRLGVPICFESVFPNISREFVRNGANVLAILTNDGWYDGTAAAGQHNAFAVFRAIETRRAIIRAANRGISCFVEPTGRIRPQRVLPHDQASMIVDDVPLFDGMTVYSRWGDWVSMATAITTALLFGLRAFRLRTATPADPPPTSKGEARRGKSSHD